MNITKSYEKGLAYKTEHNATPTQKLKRISLMAGINETA